MMYEFTLHIFRGQQMVTANYACVMPLRLEDANMKQRSPIHLGLRKADLFWTKPPAGQHLRGFFLGF